MKYLMFLYVEIGYTSVSGGSNVKHTNWHTHLLWMELLSATEKMFIVIVSETMKHGLVFLC